MFLLVANFKMNGDKQFYLSAVQKLNSLRQKGTELVLCPPFCYLAFFSLKSAKLGCQDISAEKDGKSTGQTSAKMLKDFNVQYAIVGHSERRALGETDQLVARKVKAAQENKIVPIVCVGENEKTASLTSIKNQVKIALSLANKDAEIVFAYEPVWAIGSGDTPTVKHIDRAIKIIKNECAKHHFNCKVLYGGSVNEKNYNEFLSSTADGFLLGGVSLKLDSFVEIINGVSKNSNRK